MILVPDSNIRFVYWEWVLTSDVDIDVGHLHWYSSWIFVFYIGYWNWMLILRLVHIWHIRIDIACCILILDVTIQQHYRCPMAIPTSNINMTFQYLCPISIPNIHIQYPYPASNINININIQYECPMSISKANINIQYENAISISNTNINTHQYQLQYPISSSTANISSNVQNKINIMWSRQTNNNRASVSWFFQKSLEKQCNIGGYGYWVLILDMGIEMAYWY